MLKINALRKSLELLLKIGPIEVLKFGSAARMSYLCSVKDERTTAGLGNLNTLKWPI